MPARSLSQVGPGGPRLDIALDMVDGGGSLELTLEYNADLFCERSMRQMAEHYLARHPNILLLSGERAMSRTLSSCLFAWLHIVRACVYRTLSNT